MSLRVLRHKGLDISGFEKKLGFLESLLCQGDFHGAGVKKLLPTPYYRVKLDKSSRLLFSLASYGGEKIILLLEVIRSHRYEKSRFLKGKAIDWRELEDDEEAWSEDETADKEIKYLDAKSRHFYFLNKPLVFDEEQEDLYHSPFPTIMIGSAGSGKTAICLEKMKGLHGEILYVTLSSYLAEHARDMYYSHGYRNSEQKVNFLSFTEFLETFAMPQGRELSFAGFCSWLSTQSCNFQPHALFEEFRGVLTGSNIVKPYLSLDDYLSLGVKQSIFLADDREKVYELFRRYITFLSKDNFYDTNILSYHYLKVISPRYDYLIVDEVQDFTNIQIYLLLHALYQKSRNNFLLCGDSNQIVHPNFFSWSQLKTLFFQDEFATQHVFRVLHRNYRSSKEVTSLANHILLLKHKRFGSVDKESNYLITANSEDRGEVHLLREREESVEQLNRTSLQSTKFAVIVLHDQDKIQARKIFKTPLLFSIREVKGLEYENIILYNLIGSERKLFHAIAEGVAAHDLQSQVLAFRRGKNKSDKSLEIYKFFINSLYVASSRSTKNLYIVERSLHHPLIALLGLREHAAGLRFIAQDSSHAEWQREAQRLIRQGKEEQAQAINSQILKIIPVPWQAFSEKDLPAMVQNAYYGGAQSQKQAQRHCLAYGVLFHDPNIFTGLMQVGYEISPIGKNRKDFVISRYAKEWGQRSELSRHICQYGIDYRNRFGLTPLMMASLLGHTDVVKRLLEDGAQSELTDLAGRSAFDIATSEALLDAEYSRHVYPELYRLLAPSCLKLKVENRLIKIEPQQMEYCLLVCLKNAIIFWLQEKVQAGHLVKPAFNAQELCQLLERLPPEVLASRRKKRAYISAILAKNEREKSSSFNRKIFMRVQQGYYLINPQLELRVGEDWQPLVSLWGLERFLHTVTDDKLKQQLQAVRERYR